MKILVTFLGTGKYNETLYRFRDFEPVSTAYVAAAFAQWFGPDRILVFVTKEAEQAHGEGIRQTLGEDWEKAEFVPIPSGADEGELWEIFGALAENIAPDSSLILDVTHAFRSLPILSLIALAYLRTTRRVGFDGLYYGAYEARNRQTGEVPVFDLGEFVRLFDWLTAADAFTRTGNADRLSELLIAAQRSWWQSGGRDKADAPHRLQSLGGSMKIAADNLLLLRTRHFAEGAGSLRLQTENARPEVARHAPPFAELIDKVCADLAGCAGDAGNLSTQRDLVAWLVGRNQITAAFTLAREWLLGLFAAHLKGSAAAVPADYDSRKPYETAIGHLAAQKAGKKPRHGMPEPDPELLRKANALDAGLLSGILAAWEKIRQIRNDLNHAGFSDDCRDARSIRNAASALVQTLASLPLPGAAEK